MRAFLEQWRPLVDEVVVAVDERAHPDTTNGCARFADQVYVVPAASAHMERYLGWLHSCCSGEWILRADDDELPSEALKEVLGLFSTSASRRTIGCRAVGCTPRRRRA